MERDSVLEKMYEEAVRLRRLLSVHFELTHNCNLRCKHCYVCPSKGLEMDADTVIHVLEKIAERGALFLTFTGGEPLVREDFFEIALAAKALGFSIRVFTNGTLIGEKEADIFGEISPLEVGVSLYGANPETHDSITGVPGSYLKTRLAAEALIKRGVRVTIKSVIMKPNFEEYGELIDYSKGIGAKYLFDITVFPKDDGDKQPLVLRLEDERIEKIFLDPRLRGAGGEGRSGCRGPVCDLNTASIAISPEGDIFPCLQLRISLGNVAEGEIDSGISKITAKDGPIKRILKENELKLCYNCNVRKYCTRCPGLAQLEDGDVMGPSLWACRIAASRGKSQQ